MENFWMKTAILATMALLLTVVPAASAGPPPTFDPGLCTPGTNAVPGVPQCRPIDPDNGCSLFYQGSEYLGDHCT